MLVTLFETASGSRQYYEPVQFLCVEFVGGVTSTSRSIDCMAFGSIAIPRSVVRALADLSIPVMVIVFYMALWAIIARRHDEGSGYFAKRSVLSFVAMCYVSYTSVTRTAVGVFDCIHISDVVGQHIQDTKRWTLDTTVVCYGQSHVVMVAIAIPLFLIFSLGFPVLFAWAVVKNVDRDNYKNGWIYDTMGFLYRSYRPECIAWEAVVMLRKAALAAVIVFAYPLGGNLQTVLVVAVLLFMLYLHIIHHPFREEFNVLNRMEGLSLLFSLVTIVCGQILSTDRVSNDGRTVVNISLAVIHVGLLFYFALVILNLGVRYLKAVLVVRGISHDPDGGMVHIYKAYLFSQMSMAYKAVGRSLAAMSKSKKTNAKKTNANMHTHP